MRLANSAHSGSNLLFIRALSHLPLGDEDASERVEAHRGSVARLAQPALQVEHGNAGAEELRDVVQQQQPVPQRHDGDLLQVVVLHGNLQESLQAFSLLPTFQGRLKVFPQLS